MNRRQRNRKRYAPLLRGRGLEIGALDHPFPFQPGAEVVYSDIWTAGNANPPDIISDSESFPSIADGAFDFVVANHVLEHLTDPIAALIEWNRIVRDGGLLFMALPDKRYTFDRPRERTTLEHLIGDHTSNADRRDRNYGHLVEWATHVERLQPESPEWRAWIAHAYENGGMVHNHVWVAADVLQVLLWLSKERLAQWSVVVFRNTSPVSNEFVLLLRKEEDAKALQRALLRAYAGEPLQIVLSAGKTMVKRLLLS